MDINELLKQFAEIDDMEAPDGMNIREDLDANIIKASENIGQKEMVYMLLDIVKKFVDEETFEKIKTNFEDDINPAEDKNIREAVGDVIDQRKGLNGNDWTRTEEGKFTFEIQGVPVEYMLAKHVETDKDTKDVKTTEYEITLTKEGRNAILDQVQDKIKQEFIEQAKMYGVNVDHIGSSINIGIPCDANYTK